MYNSKKTYQLGGYQNIFHPPLEGWFTELLHCLDFGQLPSNQMSNMVNGYMKQLLCEAKQRFH